MTHTCDIHISVALEKVTLCKVQLHFYKKKMQLNFPQLLQLRQQLHELTSPEKLMNIIDNENFVLLFVADKQHLLFVEISDLLFLKEEIDSFFSVSV